MWKGRDFVKNTSRDASLVPHSSGIQISLQFAFVIKPRPEKHPYLLTPIIASYFMYELQLFLFENNMIYAGNNNRRPASCMWPAQMMPAAHDSFRRILTYSSPLERRATFS